MPAPAPAAAPNTVAGAVAPVQFNPMVFCSPAFYKSLFNIDTADVVARLRLALYPFGTTQFLSVAGPNPDMYGPLWVCATLVFVIGASSNLASWVRFKPDDLQSLWEYDFTKVTAAMFTVFGWALGAPLVLWGLLQYVGVVSPALQLVTLLCVYGYSVAVFIPAAVSARPLASKRPRRAGSGSTCPLAHYRRSTAPLRICRHLTATRVPPRHIPCLQLVCVLPSTVLQWMCVMAATLTSSVFVLKAVWPSIRDGAPPSQGRTLVLATFAAQVGFGLALKFYFFSF